MRRLLALLLIGFLLLVGCASKGASGKSPADKTATLSNQSAGAPQPPPGQNGSADEQLEKGLGMFDFTVDPLISDSGFGGTMPK